jgi:hypothetical protein
MALLNGFEADILIGVASPQNTIISIATCAYKISAKGIFPSKTTPLRRARQAVSAQRVCATFCRSAGASASSCMRSASWTSWASTGVRALRSSGS